MKSMRSIVFGALLAVALYCVVRLLLPGSPAVPPAGSPSAGARRASRSARPRQTVRSVKPHGMTGFGRRRLSSDERLVPVVRTADVEPLPAEAPTVAASMSEENMVPVQEKAPDVAGTAPAPTSGQPPIQDPMAREALALVGVDPEAEWYWYAAINDPNLPAQERQDLIEDLNEDGLSDPQHPTADDLPLILSRIELIEEIVWDAMDEVNANAFLEAYNDLVNLAFQAMENE